MSEDFDWERAHELYLLVFTRLHSRESILEDKTLADAVKYLRTMYEFQTYCVGRRFHQYRALEDEASSAWTRFVIHCLVADKPYRAFRNLVRLQTEAALLDELTRRCAQKRNDGKTLLSYDERQEGNMSPGVVSAVQARPVDFGPHDVSLALDALVADGLITDLQHGVFRSYVYEGSSVRDLMKRYQIAKATAFRYVKHVGRLLRQHL